MLHESIYTKFKLFACDVLRKVGTSVGWDAKPTDDHLTSLLRSLVIPKLGLYGFGNISCLILIQGSRKLR